MSKRITSCLDDDLAKKLRIIQSKKITNSSTAVSFSRVLNDQIRKALK